MGAHVDVAVVGVADKLVPTTFKLTVELVEHEIRQEWRERAALRYAVFTRCHETIEQYSCRKVLPDEFPNGFVLHSLHDKTHEDVMVDPVEEFLQIDVDDHLVSALDVPLHFLDRAVRTSLRTETVAVLRKRGVP